MRPEDLVPSTQPVVAQNEQSQSLSTEVQQSSSGWGMSSLFGGWRFMAQAAQQQAAQSASNAPASQPTTITELPTEEEQSNSNNSGGDHNK